MAPIIKPKVQYFTTRWETLWKVWLNRISAECIGRLIIRWLRTNDYAIYQVAKNNCQHFVRDLTASLDLSAAKKLNSLFDHKVIASLLPAVAIADGMTEEVRTYEIRNILIDEMNHYNKGQQKKKRKQIQELESKQERIRIKMEKRKEFESKRQQSPRSPITFSPRTEKFSPRMDVPHFDIDHNVDSNEMGNELNGSDHREPRARSSAISNPSGPTVKSHGSVDEKRMDSLGPRNSSKTDEMVRLESLIIENGLEIDNFNKIDAFFIEEDKKRIIQCLEGSDLSDERWKAQCEVVKEYVNSDDNV